MDLLSKFVRLERAADMFSIREQEISIWWFIRPRAFALLKSKATGIDHLEKTADSLGSFQALGRGLGALGQGLLHPYRSSEILALSTSSARRHVTENGQAFDVFFDFLSLVRDCDYAVMEFPDRRPHSARPYSPKVIHGDWMAARGNLARRFSARLSCRGAEVEIRDKFLDIARDIGVELSFREADHLVCRETAFVRSTMPLARAVIDAIKPRTVLVECGYSPSHMLVQIAAKQMGIPVLELQHGLISDQSVGYQFGIRNDSILEDSPFPDKILVFGDHFKHLLMTNPYIREDMIVSAGYPYLWLNLHKHRNASGAMSESILITSQPGLGGFWSDFAVKVARKTGRRVTIKPHPAEMDRIGSIFHNALSSGVVDVIADQSSLYELLSRAEFHLSVGSTSHLEAMAFGVKDIVVCAGGMEGQFTFLKQLGLPFASNADEVVQIMRNYPDIEPIKRYVGEKVFSLHKNPLEVMASVIQRSMEDSDR
jgi:hypothetical protein